MLVTTRFRVCTGIPVVPTTRWFPGAVTNRRVVNARFGVDETRRVVNARFGTDETLAVAKGLEVRAIFVLERTLSFPGAP